MSSAPYNSGLALSHVCASTFSVPAKRSSAAANGRRRASPARLGLGARLFAVAAVLVRPLVCRGPVAFSLCVPVERRAHRERELEFPVVGQFQLRSGAWPAGVDWN